MDGGCQTNTVPAVWPEYIQGARSRTAGLMTMKRVGCNPSVDRLFCAGKIHL